MVFIYAYWEKEWNGDYKYYIDKISKLGFDILEISCGAFSDYYTKDQELIDIGKYAKEKRRNIDSRVWTSF